MARDNISPEHDLPAVYRLAPRAGIDRSAPVESGFDLVQNPVGEPGENRTLPPGTTPLVIPLTGVREVADQPYQRRAEPPCHQVTD